MTKGENAECHRDVDPAVRRFVITGTRVLSKFAGPYMRAGTRVL